MEHILIDCSIEEQALLWDLAQEIWEGREQEWIPVTYSTALGATLIQIRNKEGVDTSAMHLYRIIMTETLHLIWKIHCQRRMQRVESNPSTWHSQDEIRNLWVNALNKRLMVDHLLVNRRKYGTRAMTKTKVLSTWRGTLLNEKLLPVDWLDHSGVLVGIVPVWKRLRGKHRAPH
ncbi:hypothetical protein EDD18DRAFT_1082654 [Armillaria luteobubalina]|uniref:Uncharacterized protein n=1 Tax=Armillaria luteobubalina TaxID=153913 RepID=A0AA39PP95_9AGAR|nr:hypothetical protein EDD18DRAFT_1082654 [Armillaria luteobubalina]